MATTSDDLTRLLQNISRAKPLPKASTRYTPPAVREQLLLRDYGLEAIRKAPGLRSQIQDLAAGAPAPRAGGLGIVGGVVAGGLRALAPSLTALGAPSRAVVSTIGELRDAIDQNPRTRGSLEDWKRQYNDPYFGYGTVFPGKGWTGRLIGFTGDVAFDPLTYMSFGANTVFGNIPRRYASQILDKSGQQISTRALIGSKTIVGREGRAALAKTAAALGASDNVVADIAARGRIALPEDLAQQIGLPELGVYFFGGRVKLPMSTTLGRMALSGLTTIRLGATRSRYGSAVQELLTPGGVSASMDLRNVRARLARGVALEGGMTATQGIALLTMHDADRAAANIIGREASQQIQREFANDPDVIAARSTAHAVLEGTSSGPNTSELRAAEKFRTITNGWLKRLNAEGAALDDKYVPIRERTNWFPWTRTEAANDFIENSQSAHALNIRKYLRVNPFDVEGSFNARQIYDDVISGREVIWFGTKLTPDDVRAGVARLNKIAMDSGAMKGEFFETDLIRSMVRYMENYASQMGHYAAFKALVGAGFDPMAVAGYAPIRGVIAPEALARMQADVVGLQEGVASRVGELYDQAAQIQKAVSSGLRLARQGAARASGLSDIDIRRVMDLGLDAVEIGAPARAAAEDAYRLGLVQAEARWREAQLTAKTLRESLRSGVSELRQKIEGESAQIVDWSRRHERIIEALELVDAKLEELRVMASSGGFEYGNAERQAGLLAREKELNKLLAVAADRSNEAAVLYNNKAQWAETAFEALEDISAFARATTVASDIEEAIFGGRLDRVGVTKALPKRDVQVLHSAARGQGDENLDAWVRFRDEVLGGFVYGINKVVRIKNRNEAIAKLSQGATENGGLEDVTVAAQWVFARLQLNDPTWASRQMRNMDKDVSEFVGAYRGLREMQEMIFGNSADAQSTARLVAAREELEEARNIVEEAMLVRRQIDSFSVSGRAIQDSFRSAMFGVGPENLDRVLLTEDYAKASRWARDSIEQYSSAPQGVLDIFDYFARFFEDKIAQLERGIEGEDNTVARILELLNAPNVFPESQNITSGGKSFDVRLPRIFEPERGEDALATFRRQMPEFEARLREAESKFGDLLTASSERVQKTAGAVYENGLGKAMSALSRSGMDLFVKQEVDFVLKSATETLRSAGTVLTDEGRAALTRQTISVIADRVLSQKSVMQQALTAWQAVRARFSELTAAGLNTEYSTALLQSMFDVMRNDAAKEAMLQTTAPVLLAARGRLQNVKEAYLLLDTDYEKWMNEAVEFYVKHMPAGRVTGGAALYVPERGALQAQGQAALERSEQSYRFLGSVELQRSVLKERLLGSSSHKARLGVIAGWKKNIQRASTSGYFEATGDGMGKVIDKQAFDAAFNRLTANAEQVYGVAKARAATSQQTFDLGAKRIGGKEFGNRQGRRILTGKQRGGPPPFEPFSLSRISRDAMRRRTTRGNVLALFRDLLGGTENDTSLFVGDIKYKIGTVQSNGVRHVNEEDAYFASSLSAIDSFAADLRKRYGLYSDNPDVNKQILGQVDHIEYLESQIRRLAQAIEERPAAKRKLAAYEKQENLARKQLDEAGVDVEARIGEAQRLGLTRPAPGKPSSAVRRAIDEIRPSPTTGRLAETDRLAAQSTAEAIRGMEAAAPLLPTAFTPAQRTAVAAYLNAKRELAELVQTEEFGIAFVQNSRREFRDVLAGWELGDERLLELPGRSAESAVWGGQKDTQYIRAQIVEFLQRARGTSFTENGKRFTNVTDSPVTDVEGFVMLARVGAHRIRDPFGKRFGELLQREARADLPPLVFLTENGRQLKSAQDAYLYLNPSGFDVAANQKPIGNRAVTIIDPMTRKETVSTPLGDVVETDVSRAAQLEEGMEYNPSETWVRLREDYDVTDPGLPSQAPQREFRYRYFRLADFRGFETRPNLPLGIDFTDAEFESLFTDFSAPIFRDTIRGERTYTAARQQIIDDINALRAETKFVDRLVRQQESAPPERASRTLSMPIRINRKRKVGKKFQIVEEEGFDTRTYVEWNKLYGADVAARLAAKTQQLAELDDAYEVLAARVSARRKLAQLYTLFDDEGFQGRAGLLNKSSKATPRVALGRWLESQQSVLVRATPEIGIQRRAVINSAWNSSSEGRMMARAAALRQQSNNRAIDFLGQDETLLAQYRAAKNQLDDYKLASNDTINASNVAAELFRKLRELGYEPKSMTVTELRRALVRAEKNAAKEIRQKYPLVRPTGGAATVRQTAEIGQLRQEAETAAQELVNVRKQLGEISSAKEIDKAYSDQFDGLVRQRRELTGAGVPYPGKGVVVRGAKTRKKPRAIEQAEATLVDAVGTLNALRDARTASRTRGMRELRSLRAKVVKADAAVENAERAYDAAKGAATANDVVLAQQRLNVIRDAMQKIGDDFSGVASGRRPKRYRSGMTDRFFEFAVVLDDAADLLERVLDPAIAPEIRAQIVSYADLATQNVELAARLGQAEELVALATGTEWAGKQIAPAKARFYADVFDGSVKPDEIVQLGDVSEMTRFLGTTDVAWVPHFEKGLVRLSKQFPSIQVREELAEIIQNTRRLQEPEILRQFNKTIGRYTQFFKTYATLSPGFHLRNAISNTFMLFAAGADIRTLNEGLQLSRSLGEWLQAGRGTTEMWVRTLPQEQQRAAEIAVRAAAASGMGASTDLMRNFFTQGKALNNPATRTSRSTMLWIETHSRFMLAYDSAAKGMDMSTSAARVRRFLIDYEDVSTLDKALRQIIPFWMWTSRNLPLQIQNMWLNPKAYAVYGHIKKNFSEKDDDAAVPEWMRELGAFRLPFGQNLYAQPDLPFTRLEQDIQMTEDPARLLSNVTPLLRLPIELFGERQLYSGRRFSETPVPVEGGIGAILQPLLQIAGYGETGPTGQKFVNDKAYYALRNLIPSLATAERLSPSTSPYIERGNANPLLGFLGAPVRKLTPEMESGERKRRKVAMQEALRQYKVTGNTP